MDNLRNEFWMELPRVILPCMKVKDTRVGPWQEKAGIPRRPCWANDVRLTKDTRHENVLAACDAKVKICYYDILVAATSLTGHLLSETRAFRDRM